MAKPRTQKQSEAMERMERDVDRRYWDCRRRLDWDSDDQRRQFQQQVYDQFVGKFLSDYQTLANLCGKEEARRALEMRRTYVKYINKFVRKMGYDNIVLAQMPLK